MFTRVLHTIGGLWELARFALRGAMQKDHPYWRWRHETAFGSDPQRWPSRAERRKAMFAYGRWVHRMKRMRA